MSTSIFPALARTAYRIRQPIRSEQCMYNSSARNLTNTARQNAISTFPTKASVPLAYDQYLPANGNKEKGPLVILHGLMGSKRNWLSLAKAFARDLNIPIYALDLRNHGSSPHCLPMTYRSMALDVLHFIESKGLSNVSLLGHSMGGKVAMTCALSPGLPPNTLTNLIVADITPAKGDMSLEFRSYIEGMKKVEASEVTTRNEASDILIKYEQDPAIRAFLLTNLIPASSNNTHASFRIPLSIIEDAIPELGSFPYEPGERSWNGSVLFIKGSKSKYVNHRNIPLSTQYFPNMRMETLEAGHWVHAEAPNEFKKQVIDFIGTKV